MSIHPPLSTTFRISISSLLTAISAVPIGLWVNILSVAVTPTVDLWPAIKSLGWSNSYLALGLSVMFFNLCLQFIWDKQDVKWQQFITSTRARRDLRTQLQVLEMYCNALERALRVRVSARLFSIKLEKLPNGTTDKRMYQIRDVFVEHEFFRQETAFTFVSMSNQAFVVARSFDSRAPIFEILPADHSSLYGDREKKMVDPAQRWVLCSPVLQYDMEGHAKDELEPKGMVVFYGKSEPSMDSGEMDFALTLCRDTAELFSILGNNHHS